jgi:hypothetical protein
MEGRGFTVYDVGQGWRLAMVVGTRSTAGGHRLLGKVGGMGKGTCVGERNLRQVEGQLFRSDLDKFASSIGHPPVETFPSIPDPEFTMVQVLVELIPEFLQNLYPCLCFVAFDLHSLKFVLALY